MSVHTIKQIGQNLLFRKKKTAHVSIEILFHLRKDIFYRNDNWVFYKVTFFTSQSVKEKLNEVKRSDAQLGADLRENVKKIYKRL